MNQNEQETWVKLTIQSVIKNLSTSSQLGALWPSRGVG